MNKLPNVLFLLIDALRADQCYGNKTKTPTIDSLIENGVYFKQAIAPNDGTFLSLNSLFSGKFSFRTKNRAQKIILAKNNFLEILKTNGYHIYGLIPNLTSFNPLSKSFENNENMYEHGPPTEVLSKGLGQKIIEFLNSKK
uniref:Sulfatase n=1 Tax=uncultured marine thaumarchaeote SAT1000_07_E05 TaxID=1456364 RepID=A0A075I0E2_9ARCH|nr:sulfatase [uncultured marine thaumarchaeote SAT1000_07_E05]